MLESICTWESFTRLFSPRTRSSILCRRERSRGRYKGTRLAAVEEDGGLDRKAESEVEVRLRL
jgi:hypothetical protein